MGKYHHMFTENILSNAVSVRKEELMKDYKDLKRSDQASLDRFVKMEFDPSKMSDEQKILANSKKGNQPKNFSQYLIENDLEQFEIIKKESSLYKDGLSKYLSSPFAAEHEKNEIAALESSNAEKQQAITNSRELLTNTVFHKN
jgi:hypothetical protein